MTCVSRFVRYFYNPSKVITCVVGALMPRDSSSMNASVNSETICLLSSWLTQTSLLPRQT